MPLVSNESKEFSLGKNGVGGDLLYGDHAFATLIHLPDRGSADPFRGLDCIFQLIGPQPLIAFGYQQSLSFEEFSGGCALIASYMYLQSTIIHGENLVRERIPCDPLFSKPLRSKPKVEAETRSTRSGQQYRPVIVDFLVRRLRIFGTDSEVGRVNGCLYGALTPTNPGLHVCTAEQVVARGQNDIALGPREIYEESCSDGVTLFFPQELVG